MTEDGSGKTNRCNFKLEGLHLNDLPADRIDIAKKELCNVVSLIEKSAPGIGLKHDVFLNIYLTNQMGKCVNRIQNGYGQTPLTPYNPLRNSVVAQGITLCHPHCPPLRISVVIDQDSWLKDANETILLRIYLISHELGHVLQRARETGMDWHQPAQPKTHTEVTKRLAAIIRDEFDADSNASNFCRIFLRNNEGKPVLPGGLLGPWFMNSAKQLLGKISNFAVYDVQNYRMTAKGLEELYPKIHALMEEFLVVLAHTVVFYAQIEKMDAFRAELNESRGFSSYIGGDLDGFLHALTEQERISAEIAIIHFYGVILDRAGLQIEDLPDGNRYVYVHKPIIALDTCVCRE